jgi:hypothetical protein
MSWLASLVKALNPCIHIFETVETLKDHPKDPRHVVLIQACSICGDTRTVEFDGPGRGPPPWICPPHKWKKTYETRLVDDVRAVKENKPHSTVGYIISQTCGVCGEMRTIRQGFQDGSNGEIQKRKKDG